MDDMPASMGLALLAATFVTEAETWPVFLEWNKKHGAVPAVPREHAQELVEVIGMAFQEALMFTERLMPNG